MEIKKIQLGGGIGGGGGDGRIKSHSMLCGGGACKMSAQQPINTQS